MPNLDMHPCFGIELLGMCQYDPQAPFATFFTIGDAVAALAFTLAVQQFLKPIFRFRLATMGTKFSYVLAAVFFGGLCTLIATAVPNITLLRNTPFGYPLNWEIAGGLVIALAYAVVASISLRPAKVTKRNARRFAWAGAELLSSASDEDRFEFSRDVLDPRNFARLVEYSAAFSRAEQHAVKIEFEKLRENGREAEGVKGRPVPSAFYEFANRTELKIASDSWHFLQVLSDQDFCRVIITRNSWNFVRAIDCLAQPPILTEGANSFIQAVTWQALVQEDGILAKEVGYDGFGFNRNFSNAFFGDPKLLQFEPLGGFHRLDGNLPSEGFVSRLNVAAKLLVNAELESRGFWGSSSTRQVTGLYENLARQSSYSDSMKEKRKFLSEYSSGVEALVELIIEKLDRTEIRTYNALFAREISTFRNDILSCIAHLVSEGFNSVANGFGGSDDVAWIFVQQVYSKIFPRYGDVPVGLSPLQQAVAILLIEKLDDNMRGYYPTVSRILLAVIGPYKTRVPEKPGSAAAIVKNAVYFELRRLPALYVKDRNKALERLPSNVTYDHSTKTLTHTYFGGKKVKTNLGSLRIQKIDLLAKEILRDPARG